MFLATLPRSCEDYFLRRRRHHLHSLSGPAALISQTSPSYRNPTASTVKLRRAHATNLTIDLDGGGPLKPFNVVCSRFGDSRTDEVDIDNDDATILGKFYNSLKIIIWNFLEHNLMTPNGVFVSGSTEPGKLIKALECLNFCLKELCDVNWSTV